MKTLQIVLDVMQSMYFINKNATFSIKVDSRKEDGDFEAAKTYSNWAKYLSCAAIIIGVIILLVVVVVVVAVLA